MLFIVPSNKGQVFEESVNYSVINISGKVGVKFNKSRVQDQECVYRSSLSLHWDPFHSNLHSVMWIVYLEY